MAKDQDSLQLLPFDQWPNLQDLLKADFHRGITGYNVLETQRRWKNNGVDFVLNVFCPYGDMESGMVAVLCDTDVYFVIMIECPRDNTSKLEEALKKTKIIDWKRDLTILYVSEHVKEGLQRIADDINVTIDCYSPLQFYVLDKNSPLFDVSLPADVTFKPLSPAHAYLVNSYWPHRYPGSSNYFLLLIQAKAGFGLFKNDELITWAFVKETGSLGSIYTLDEHRRKGYGEMITQLVCNVLLEQKRYVNSYCLERNVASCRMHEKLGFERFSDLMWLHSTRKAKSQDDAISRNL